MDIFIEKYKTQLDFNILDLNYLKLDNDFIVKIHKILFNSVF